MKGNAKLYSVNDISNILEIAPTSVRNRADNLKLIPQRISGSNAFFYDFNQFQQITNYTEDKVKADIVTKHIETIVHHVTWQIRDSKLNFLTIEQLPEWQR